VERRLAAILAADVAGYTALMGADEAGTFARLTTLRQEALEPLIAAHRGRVVKLMGDGILVEFASVVDAVACALAWQKAAADQDKDLQFRIGINLGDVIVEGEDIHGDGVNIAARLEALAEPGGICLSDDAYRQAKGKTKARFEDLGEKSLKNVAEPVRVYRIASDRTTGAAQSREPLALSDKPSIAVLPFTNMSGDPEQEYFSDGITEDIITELSRFRSLFVIARNSSFHYKGQSPKIQDVARELGVHYVVEGSVRKSGNRVRITAQLIEAESRSHLWAERYDRNLENIFDVQDEVVQEIAAAVPGQLTVAAMDRARQRPTENLSAYDCLMHGEWLMYRDFADPDVMPLFARAVELDPQCARAYIQLSRLHAYSYTQGVPIEKATGLSIPLAEKALDISPSDPSIQAIAANTFMMLSEHNLARQHIERAISLNPNDGEVIASAVFILNYLGRREEALRWNEIQSRQDPIWSDGYRENAIDLYYMARRYEDAIAVYQSWRNPPIWVHVEIAAAFAQNGQPAEANATMESFLRIRPEGFDAAAVIRHHLRQCAKPEDAEHWREGYRKVGLEP
jgi:TolB-like protein